MTSPFPISVDHHSNKADQDEFNEIRVSLRLILMFFVVLGPVLYMVLSTIPHTAEVASSMMTFSLLFELTALFVWWIDTKNHRISRYALVVSAIILFTVAGLSGYSIGTLPFVVFPVGLAAVLLNFHEAFVVSIIETVALILSRVIFPYLQIDAVTIFITLIIVWGVFGLLFAISRPLKELVRWSRVHSQQAMDALKVARDSQLELNQALADLAEANVQLKRMNQMMERLHHIANEARLAKEQFVSNVSHELRTPLNMVIGYCEMIMRSPESYGSSIPTALLADLSVILRNASHLSDLVDDVLDLSQVDSGTMALTPEPVDIRELISSVQEAVRPLYDSKGLYLESQIDADIPQISCDRTRIREVLLNLVSNAGRFTEQGGVLVRAWQDATWLYISVTDTGPGIEAEKINLLFQPFQQLDSSIRRRYGGTGLGLSISKRFVELHGGKIWVESSKGQGTKFTFQLPLAVMDSDKGGYRRGLSPNWEFLQRTRENKAPITVVRPRYLVYDQTGYLYRILKRYLTTAEIQMVDHFEDISSELAKNPSQAVLVNSDHFDSSFTMLANKPLPYQIPMILCSVPTTTQVYETLGVSNVLIKPISQDMLLKTIGSLKLSGKTILIVDDEPDALRLFRRMLLAADPTYRVLRARDGQEALKMLQKEQPDVILLDLVMPNMDGFELLKLIKKDPVKSKIPVVLISARDPSGHPIISNAVALMHQGGLSIQHLLRFIQLSEAIFVPEAQAGDQKPAKVFPQ